MLITVLCGCSGDHLPKFAQPSADAGKPDAGNIEDDGGAPVRDR